MITSRAEPSRRDARRTRRSAALLLAVAAILAVPATAAAQPADVSDAAAVAVGAPPSPDGAPPPPDDAYVTTTTGSDRSLDVSAFSPSCVGDAPYISYAIVPRGFTSSGPAVLSFLDRNGNFVEQRTVPTLTGRTIFPGASVDASGNAVDWPGWKLAEDGVSWIPDPSDAFLREGLTVVVEVSSVTATTGVGYPTADSGCANPPGETPPTTTIAPTTTVCVPGEPGCGPTTTVCVPGQDGDATPADDCDLPRTGGGPGPALAIGAAALAAGLMFLLAARRTSRPTPG